MNEMRREGAELVEVFTHQPFGDQFIDCCGVGEDPLPTGSESETPYAPYVEMSENSMDSPSGLRRP